MPQVYQPANPDQNLLENGGRPNQTGVNQGAPGMGYVDSGGGGGHSFGGGLTAAQIAQAQAIAESGVLENTLANQNAQGNQQANPMNGTVLPYANMLNGEVQTTPSAPTPPTTPSNGGGGGGGGYPSGGGGGGGGGTPASSTVQAGNNTAPVQGTELGDNTNYLLNEYNNMDNYQAAMTDLINSNTAQLIDLSHAQIDELLAVQLQAYANQLDQAKNQFGVLRAKLEQMKATEADNLVLAAAANGDKGGVGRAQYSAQMQQRDQALYELDLQWINLEQQLNQAIAEAKATGNYEKLAKTIELTTAAYEQLYNLMSQVMQVKTSDAAQLDQYYEGIREFDASYNLQVQQIQQNAVLNKISAGISVSPEDMEVFGLTGADAQTAANNINTSQGIERQILAEQLRSLQNSNNGYYGGSGGGGGGGGESSRPSKYGMTFSDSVPATVESTILGALEEDGLTVLRGGEPTQVLLNSSGGFASGLQAGDIVEISGYGRYVWNGSSWVPEGQAASGGSGGSGSSGGQTLSTADVISRLNNTYGIAGGNAASIGANLNAAISQAQLQLANAEATLFNTANSASGDEGAILAQSLRYEQAKQKLAMLQEAQAFYNQYFG